MMDHTSSTIRDCIVKTYTHWAWTCSKPALVYMCVSPAMTAVSSLSQVLGHLALQVQSQTQTLTSNISPSGHASFCSGRKAVRCRNERQSSPTLVV